MRYIWKEQQLPKEVSREILPTIECRNFAIFCDRYEIFLESRVLPSKENIRRRTVLHMGLAIHIYFL